MSLKLRVNVSALCGELSNSTYAAVTLHMLVTYVFPLNNMFLHETYISLSVDFRVENFECSKLPLTGSKVPPGWGSFKQNTEVTKIGSASKTSRRGGFAYYLIAIGNIIMYVSFYCNHLHLFIYFVRV